MRFRILQCLARAVVKHGVKFLCNLAPGGGAVYDFAADVWDDYRRDAREDALRAELQALAQAPADQVRPEVEAAVEAEAAAQPPDVRQALTAYLTQVPAAIRRSLRRPSDPTGTTLPATVALSRPEDLMPFLPPRPPRFKAGDRPVPNRVLEEPLGIGGFGEVWKARSAHLQSKAPVVLKFCLDAAAAKALRNEAGVLDRVMQHGRHPGIVPLLDAHLDAEPPCLEYALVEGGDLGGLIQEMHARGEMTLDAANRLLLRLAEIVASVHRASPPIVHCDLKPANVLVRRTANGEHELYVTDFGIGGLAATQAIRESRQPTRSRQELMTEAVRGAYTPLYASLEQMTRPRDQPPDPRDDVHALGVIWYQLLTGDLGMLSVPTDWREQVEERGLSDDLVKLLASCIAPRATQRPASAQVLAEELQAALAGPTRDDIAARRKSEEERRRRQEVERQYQEQQAAEKRRREEEEQRQREEQARQQREESERQRRQEKEQRRPGELITLSLGAVKKGGFLGIGGTAVDVSMRFAWIPPGTFLMGSPPDEEGRWDDETQHRVTLTRGFYLGIHPVTQAQWRAVMGSRPSHFQGDNRPVEQVSWDDCQTFCAKLGELTGERVRLPTEAEWEYACRAGTTTPFSFGETISTDRANYDGTITYGRGRKGVYRRQTMPVGTSPANAWGLFDMHGNVFEWCQDLYGPYPQGDVTDAEGSNNGSARVLRGGSWYNDPRRCRSAYRYGIAPGNHGDDVGCRVVRCQD